MTSAKLNASLFDVASGASLEVASGALKLRDNAVVAGIVASSALGDGLELDASSGNEGKLKVHFDGSTLVSNGGELSVADGSLGGAKLSSSLPGIGLDWSDASQSTLKVKFDTNMFANGSSDELQLKNGGISLQKIKQSEAFPTGSVFEVDANHALQLKLSSAGCLEEDTGGAGLTVKVDTTAGLVLSNAGIQISSGGVKKTHLNANVVDPAGAIDFDSTNGLNVKGNGLTFSMLDTAVFGDGIGVASNQFVVKADGNHGLQIDASDGLQLKPLGIATEKLQANCVTSAKIASQIALAELEASTQVKSAKFIATSDRRLKTGVQYVQPMDALREVMQMRAATYEFKATPGVKRQGVIAQDLLPVAPHLVSTVNKGCGDKEHLAVNYIDMVASLIGAVQALQTQVDEQRDELRSLKQSIKG